MNVADPRLNYEHRADVCRIESSHEVAVCLCDAFAIRVRDPRSVNSAVVVACAMAVTAVLDALERRMQAAMNQRYHEVEHFSIFRIR